MASLFDNFMDIFYSFRLGNSSHSPNRCLYIQYTTETNGRSSSSDNHGGHKTHSSQLLSADDIPSKDDDILRVIIVSDTHLRHDTIGSLPIGDIFIHSGDIFMTNRMLTTTRSIQILQEFNDWLSTIPCSHKVVICGNHDKVIEDIGMEQVSKILSNGIYLQNSFIEVDGIKIWGTPLSSGRSGNSAFQSREFHQETMTIIENIIGNEIDILVTHGPNYHLAEKLQPQLLYVWGHAHGAHGLRHTKELSCPSVNASIMDTKYNPSQVPVVIDIIHPRRKNTKRT